LPGPFIFRTTAGPSVIPADVRTIIQPVGSALVVDVTVMPHEPGLTIHVLMPPDVVPWSSTIPGRLRTGGRWRATFAGVPSTGVVLRIAVEPRHLAALSTGAIAIVSTRVPGGAGWQHLPRWLPQETAVWTGRAVFLLPLLSDPVGATTP
jgi:hypothetical protein